MKEKVTVRRATRADLAAIARIYNYAVEHTVATFDVERVTIEERTAWFAQFDDSHPLFVCDVAEEVAGYAYYVPFRQKAAYAKTKECTVYVAPERQRNGVGSALYGVLVAHARENGVHALIGVLGGDNAGSVALHRRFGFDEVGHLRDVGYKFGKFVDTHYFEKILAGSATAPPHEVEHAKTSPTPGEASFSRAVPQIRSALPSVCVFRATESRSNG